MVLERKREGELGEKEHARKEEEAHEQGMIDERRHQEQQHDGKDEHRQWRTTDHMGRSEDGMGGWDLLKNSHGGRIFFRYLHDSSKKF